MSAHQPAFDFSPAPARPTDPVTSQMAAEANRELRARHRRLALQYHYIHRETGLDDFQLEALTGIKQTSIGKRRGELCDVRRFNPPLVENSGEQRKSPSGLTKSAVTVWRITSAGIEAYLRGQQ